MIFILFYMRAYLSTSPSICLFINPLINLAFIKMHLIVLQSCSFAPSICLFVQPICLLIYSKIHHGPLGLIQTMNVYMLIILPVILGTLSTLMATAVEAEESEEEGEKVNYIEKTWFIKMERATR